MTDNPRLYAAKMALLSGIVKHARNDCFAEFNIQTGKGYTSVRRKVNYEAIRAHEAKETPIGIYLVTIDKTQIGVLDIDDHDGTLTPDAMQEYAAPILAAAKKLGLKYMICRSGGGRGIHIWFLWHRPQPCRQVRRLLASILAKAGLKNGTTGIENGTVEIFPKQDSVNDGAVGNLIALPFSRQSVLVDNDLNAITASEIIWPEIEDLYNDPIREDFTQDIAGGLAEKLPPYANAQLDGDETEVESALLHIPADDHDLWIKIGMSLKCCFGDNGFNLFNNWSAKSAKYKGSEDARKRWDSLAPDGSLTVGTIFYHAQKAGWNGPSNPEIREMNAKYGILTHGNKTQIIEKIALNAEQEILRCISKETLKDRYRARKVKVGDTSMSLADYWLSHSKASHFQIVQFDPDATPHGNGVIWNLWGGFPVQPCPGDWSLLGDHIYQNICQGNEETYQWLLNWMALGVQRPGSVIGTAPVFGGLPGTGKGFLVYCYASLWGKHFIAITHESHVSGRFNVHLAGKRLVFIDEGIFGGDRKNAGVIKTRITEPFLMVERKGVDPISMKNRMIFMVASNEECAVPADIGDRRWQIFAVGEKRREDHAYFAAIKDQFDNGGREAFFYDLLHRRWQDGPDPRKTIKNAALFEQIILAQKADIQYIYQFLEAGTLPQPYAKGNGPGTTTIRALYAAMLQERPTAAKFIDLTLFGKKLKSIFPNIALVQSGTYLNGGTGPANVERSMRYTFPSLKECRRDFEKFMNQSVPWTNDFADWLVDTPNADDLSDMPF